MSHTVPPGYRVPFGNTNQIPGIRDSIRMKSCDRGSERLEESPVAESGLTKTRVRYSSTARRCYKKQLQREGQAEKAQSPTLRIQRTKRERYGQHVTRKSVSFFKPQYFQSVG
ncbi:uncharacterized protein LOC112463008 [Temnothorax curvispinosus]|uniref:Uncharacterized protein LOC112463008 n=1 Tax=Temnothorax curvispinosus TaxID=300111 RepID=A0A6J1QR59_9HYME|nr:uncharacterized protein LOC112463008 [Temnothorax curvispinosus]